MRVFTTALALCLCVAGATVVAQTTIDKAELEKKPLFNTSKFVPQIAFHPTASSTADASTTVTGIVFSRAPIDRVTVDERVAMIRPAEPKDLMKLTKAPRGASDAPFRTFFEVPDAALLRIGANDVSVVASSSDGRVSHTHRVTIIRTLGETTDQTAEGTAESGE